MTLTRTTATLIAFLLLTIPAITFAEGLVPCDGPECQTCNFVKLVQNVITFFVQLIIAASVLIFAYAGFKMVTSAGNTSGISAAKEKMTNAVVGLVILLTAWLIVDTFMKSLVDSGKLLKPWDAIDCVAQPVGTAGGVGGGLGTGGGGDCTDCVVVPSGINIKSNACSGGNPCTVSPTIAPKLTDIDRKLDAAGIGWQITEAYPPTGYSASDPTGIHTNACHGNGTCVDASIGSPTLGNVQTFMNTVNGSGMRAVYEGDCTTRDTLRKQGYTAYCRSDNGYGHITGTHFSVYNQ